ncbi:hypothetical protein [Pseudobutyrivibrio sp.]|uniref:hypothetical protein n=1 Tax=Pseudobutyrivibrio sp. TaxID=2014367 RepID=UPI0038677FA3
MDNGRMAGAVIGIFGTLAMFAISIVLFLLGHFYIVNGLMVGFLPFLMMTSAGYSEAVCWGVYGLIILISVILQLNFKVARIVFGVISCGVVSLFIWDKYKDVAVKTQLIYIGIGIVITGLLNIAGYCREDN